MKKGTELGGYMKNLASIIDCFGKNKPDKLRNSHGNPFSTVQYITAILKAYGIQHIVISPGNQNSMFASIVQQDNFFKLYSVVDERSAAYTATGIAYETNEPVVIACTEATASRNYISALTEAYYRKLPIIALTFFNYAATEFTAIPQHLDRSVSQNDIKTVSVTLPRISDNTDRLRFLALANGALAGIRHNPAPVHINCPSSLDYSEGYQELPQTIWTTEYYDIDFEHLTAELQNKKISVYIGSHAKFDKETEKLISDFAESYDASVFCDQSSNYHGKNKILISMAATSGIKNNPADILIDIGNVSGEYQSWPLINQQRIWRVSENGEFKCRFDKPINKLFNCKEKEFLRTLKNKSSEKIRYYQDLKQIEADYTYPEFGMSNMFVCQQAAKYLPQNSSLHLGILNSLRCMNYFKLDESIDVNVNVGGFGIDGAVSSLLGQSLVNKDKLCFGIIGDLAFFYDMNALGQRDLGKNFRIIVINNNKGVEFKLNKNLTEHLGYEGVEPYIAAAGHFKGGAKSWAETCGFKYLRAETKEEVTSQLNEFCSPDSDKPILFEIITNDDDDIKDRKEIESLAKKKC